MKRRYPVNTATPLIWPNFCGRFGDRIKGVLLYLESRREWISFPLLLVCYLLAKKWLVGRWKKTGTKLITLKVTLDICRLP